MVSLAMVSLDGHNLTLLVINRALETPITASIRLKDYSPQVQAQVFTVGASSLSDNNEDHPETVTLKTAQINDAAPRFTYNFHPHSLTMFRFQGFSGN